MRVREALGAHYVVEQGQRTMVVEPDGDVVRRYDYGASGKGPFDQAFDELGQEELVRLPLADHQNSTRVVPGHEPDGAVVVRQSVDYAPCGRLAGVVFGEMTVSVEPGFPYDTVFGWHGSLLDVHTGLQLKGARWYSPDLGRFISEDPIQDGANWYLAFGNNPVMYADPTGLYQAGHPLQSGSRQLDSFLRNSVNQALARPSLPPTTTTFGGFVDAGLGSQILGRGTSAPAYTPPPVYNAGAFHGPVNNDFSAVLSRSNSAAALTRTDNLVASSLAAPNPRLASINEGALAQARRDAMDDFRRDYGPGGKYDFRANRSFLDHPGRTELADLGSSVTPVVSDARDLYELATGRDYWSEQRLSWYGYGLTAVGTLLPVVGGSLLRRVAGASDAAHDVQRNVDTHSLQDSLDAQRYTHQIEVLPNGEVLSQFDTLGGPSPRGGTLPRQGIYEFPDASAGGTPYVGQSGNIPQRLQRHQQTGRLTGGTVPKTTEVPGGKTAREIAEHHRIQELTGGVPARHSPNVANQRDPIGPNRRHLRSE